MNPAQVRAFENALFGDRPSAEAEEGKAFAFTSVSRERMIPFLLEFVKEWHIDKVPDKPEAGDIPYKVVNWVASALVPLWEEEITIPNV